jgi:hypothetical protein
MGARKMMTGLMGILGTPNAAVVTVSGETITNSDVAITDTGVRFNASGIVEKRIDGGYFQIDNSTDWVVPNGDNDGGYTVELVVTSGDSPDAGDTFGSGTWNSVGDGQSREWYFNANGSGTWTISISDDGGSSTLDSGAYIVTHDDSV